MGANFVRMMNQKTDRKHDKDASSKPLPPKIDTGFGNWRENQRMHRESRLPLNLPSFKRHKDIRTKALKMDRVHDWLTLEQEYLMRVSNQMKGRSPNESQKLKQISAGLAFSNDDLNFARRMLKCPLFVAKIEQIVDNDHAIVSMRSGILPYYVVISSLVDKTKLYPMASVLVSARANLCIIGVLAPDPSETLIKEKMIIDTHPQVSYEEIGGLEEQINEVREVVELPLTRPELFEDMGIPSPRGVILYGPPGTGKTLIAKAVASQCKATFIKLSGSQLVRKTQGEGPKLVKNLFETAANHSPCIIFIDEIDAIGSKREVQGGLSGGKMAVQRTLIELLTCLDGFDKSADIKVIFATNRIHALDEALLRPGRVDRKVEVPLPDLKGKRNIFRIHTSLITLHPDVDVDEVLAGDMSGADIQGIVSMAAMIALREMRTFVKASDLIDAKKSVLLKEATRFDQKLYA